MTEKNKQLTIGQFAAMHGINKKTLMWYDEIGLLKPAAINPENGYRCYNYHQSPVLETILLLRELDVPVREIQDFMKNRSAEKMKNLLEEKIADLDHNLKHLQAIRKTLCNYHQNMETLLTMDLSKISIIEKEERCLITVAITPDTSFEEEVEMITAETEKYQLADCTTPLMVPCFLSLVCNAADLMTTANFLSRFRLAMLPRRRRWHQKTGCIYSPAGSI